MFKVIRLSLKPTIDLLCSNCGDAQQKQCANVTDISQYLLYLEARFKKTRPTSCEIAKATAHIIVNERFLNYSFSEFILHNSAE